MADRASPHALVSDLIEALAEKLPEDSRAPWLGQGETIRALLRIDSEDDAQRFLVSRIRDAHQD